MPWGADTAVTIDLIHTGRPEGTRGRLALVDVYSAVGPSEAGGAFTAVPVLTIHACATVITGMRTAVIGVLCADGPLPAFLADTREGLAIDHAGAPIVAGAGQATAVPGYVAGRAFPASRAHALESVPFIIAGATVIACGLITLAVT